MCPPMTIYEYIQFSFLFISMTLAYIANYSAVEVDSPSITMILKIAKAGHKGMDRITLEQKLNNDILINPRIEDLLLSKAIYSDGKRYKLTPKGIILARIFMLFRKILGVSYLGG